MSEERIPCEISEDDLRAALREIKTYVDITEEDLKKIYVIALRNAQERIARSISVNKVMTKDTISIHTRADIHEAARLLSEHRISGLPVVDEEGVVLGVVTEADILSMTGIKEGHTFKDILRHLLGEPLPGRRRGNSVGEIMSSPAITTRPDADIRDVAKVLDEKRIKRLPVVDEKNRLIGVISRADIVRAMRR
ncbi:MAG TPA: CBS domain-containing protein [Thermodesulfovibrionales bacterium]|nr:CBS domain-containing protein [Thermodesulfovibrionales bacterium]